MRAETRFNKRGTRDLIECTASLLQFPPSPELEVLRLTQAETGFSLDIRMSTQERRILGDLLRFPEEIVK